MSKTYHRYSTNEKIDFDLYILKKIKMKAKKPKEEIALMTKVEEQKLLHKKAKNDVD